MPNIAAKYRLYPDDKQKELFEKTFGCCRKIYNLMLDNKINNYEATGKFSYPTPAQFKKEFPFLKEVDSLALANVQLNLDKAFKSCFDKKRKLRNGFPKFKSKHHSRKAYTTNNQGGTVSVGTNYIHLPKLGNVKAVIHRIFDYPVKSATISKDSDGKYYASVLFEYADNKINYIDKQSNNAIGLDYKSDGLYMDSFGNIGQMHKYFREWQKKLAKAQRILSRRKGSKKDEDKSASYLKQLLRINKIYRHLTNQRLDTLHKLSTEIANRYDIVCVESLNMKAIANRKFGNGKATLDNGYGLFLQLLEYKLNNRGKYFVKVDKWYPSSQICSACGKIHKLKLSERIYKCECGLNLNRDYNAALNILHEGLRLLHDNVI